MYELIQVAENTFCIESPSKIGIFRESEHEVWLIDSGNDKDAAKKILKVLHQHQWYLNAILLTHSHADHAGGARFLREHTSCRVYAPDPECDFVRHPVLEPSFLWGGFPCAGLRNKFLMASGCEAEPLSTAVLPSGMEKLELPGHFFGMTGFRTPDDVWFLADSMIGEQILDKYPIFFLYDAAEYLRTLERLESLTGCRFLFSHAPIQESTAPLARRNREALHQLLRLIAELCGEPVSFEEILKRIFDRYGMRLDLNQYVLAGSTIRSCLAFLKDAGTLAAEFRENRLLWRTQPAEA